MQDNIKKALIYLVGFAMGALIARPACAQTPLPDPRASFGVDYDVQWDQVYTAADGALAGQPFIQAIKLTLNAVPPATGTRTVTVPRAQLLRVGTEIQINDVPMPIGNFTLHAQWINGGGVEGGPSNDIPFVATRQAPNAVLNLHQR